tara:strand:+ start:376 stop:1350 length:975 start_codon:yes stop_codon:yes gene_type:complete
MKILVTGSAGFIGFHVCKELLKSNKYKVYGIDNLNSYYDIKLKKDRLKKLRGFDKKFKFYKIDIYNFRKLKENFKKNKYDYIIHLAAQAGVRHSMQKPKSYIDSNIVGFFNVLELSKSFNVKHLLYASTSSVYGNSINFPLSEDENTDSPLSFYAATKKANEVMAYSYSNLFKLPCTGIRMFTIYGPLGRPDMALYKFAMSIIKGKSISLYNRGNHIRDFTYVEDVSTAISKLIVSPPKKNIPHDIFNIGSNNPQKLMRFLKIIEKSLMKKSKTKKIPMQPGDVHKTHANISKLTKKIKYKPITKIEYGIGRFIEWIREYQEKN